jgi:hypothetical protein
LLLALSANAQINGVPASVSSIGFGGHFNAPPGVPASVTSIGPLGMVPNPTFSNQRFVVQPGCCINPLFPVTTVPPVVGHRHHNHQNNFGPIAYPVAYPVPYPVAVSPEDAYGYDEDADNGGLTVFDRRGPGQPAVPVPHEFEPNLNTPIAPAPVAAAAPSEKPLGEQPQTVLVYKDGHQDEVANYAIVGNLLYDLTPGHRRKIALGDLDLDATAQQNDARGIDFALPPGVRAN